MRLLSSVALISLSFSSGAFAQDVSPQEVSKRGDHHEQADPTIVVTGAYLRNRLDVLSGTTVLTEEELTRALRPTIGETLSRQPGVSATSFGPNASRPVLRGLQGERVRVLTDGIGSFDVSNTSVDHAVAINPLTAERIEVLRGPSALQFGSSAIGGVVNVIDSRIPRELTDENIHIDALLTYGSAANERAASGKIDVPLGSQIVAHLDGSYTKTDDLKIGGFVLSPELRAEAAISADPEIAALADLKDRLPNTAAESWEVAGGLALINDGGTLGISVNHLNNLYGVPIRYSLDPDIEAEAVRLDVRQTRADLRAEVYPESGFLDKIKFRAGYADYTHDELESTGEVGTSFFNNSFEGRLELVQANRDGWRGVLGAQYFYRKFDVVGEEKFLPKNFTDQFGVFTLQSLDFGVINAEIGARYERTNLTANADADIGNPFLARNYDSYSGSIGANYELAEDWRIGLNASHTERAPSAEELFANGPHAGTQAFEVGNPDFVKERSWGLEATFNGEGDGYSFSASAYHTWFDNFIYDQATGEVEDDLPIFQFVQGDAKYWGFEMEGSARLAEFGDFSLNADAVADFVHAALTDIGPVPRIPPLRLLGGFEIQSNTINARIEAEYSAKQTRIAAIETPTSDFTLVNASMSFKPFGADNLTSILLSANNIFDVNARRHASFLKDYAPLSGRDIRVTARIGF